MGNDHDVKSAEGFSVEVSAHSYLSLSRLKQYKEVVFWERTEIPDIVASDIDVFIPLNVQDRIDNLSYRAYRDPDFWWALAIANDVRLPPLQMNPGFIFRIPNALNVLKVIRGA